MKKNRNWINHVFNFLAVILGVYFAFYINDKAKIGEEKKESLLLMQSMINDLSADIKTYESFQIPVNIQYKEGVDSLLYALTLNDMKKVNDHLQRIFQLQNYAPTNTTYNSIKSSGKIRLLEDLSLQKELSNFYDGLVLECIKKNEIQVEFFMEELVNWLTVNADLLEMKILKTGDLIILRNKLLVYSSLIDQKIKNYQMIVDDSKLLKERLASLVDND